MLCVLWHEGCVLRGVLQARSPRPGVRSCRRQCPPFRDPIAAEDASAVGAADRTAHLLSDCGAHVMAVWQCGVMAVCVHSEMMAKCCMA